jgi:ubiquinone/menaquinone biosynthesis C-methylase UbiE
MNYFAHPSAAKRYAASRPYFHPLVMERIRETLELEKPLDRVLDVACGTGQSSVALKTIARHIVGTDISPEMLGEAPHDSHIHYVAGRAEALPFPDETFDLLTVSLAFHWFERERFLAEAHRVLLPDASLVIYNNGFSGQMRGNPAYTQWNHQSYIHRYPTPPRNNHVLTPEDARVAGFHLERQEAFENDVTLTPEQLAGYLTTQSNVIAAVEQGGERIEEVYRWLVEQVRPFFEGETAVFPFVGTIVYLGRG